jgi:HK97 family phage portal protein
VLNFVKHQKGLKNMLKTIASFLQLKQNPVAETMFMGAQPADASRSLKSFYKEGYAYNAIIYRCISEIVRAVQAIDLRVVDESGEEVTNLELEALLKKPNAMQDMDGLLEEMVTNFLVAGECFTVGSGISETSPQRGQKPVELWQLNPMLVTVTPSKDGVPASYVFEVGGRKTTFAVDRLTAFSAVNQTKLYNPSNYWRGLSPLSAAAISADIHNSGLRWNNGLLKNGARPSGALTYEGTPSPEYVRQLKEMIDGLYSGDSNSGRPLLLGGGMKWMEMSKSSKDMDFIASVDNATKNISAVLGVPLPLVVTDASSFNNMQTAQEMLYMNTVIPLLERMLNGLNMWLSDSFGGARIWYNTDNIAALEGRRERKIERTTRLVETGIITRNEARAALGFDEVAEPEANVLYIPVGQTPLAAPSDTSQEQELGGKALLDKLTDVGYTAEEAKEIAAEMGDATS